MLLVAQAGERVEVALRGRNLNMMAFIIICVIISYHDLKKCSRLPWPPRFVFAGLTFLMMDIVSLFDETLGGVTAIGFVIAVFLQKGFVSDCEHGVATTGQPQVVSFVGDSAGSAQPPGIASVSEYQQAQPAQAPGTTLA